MKENKNGLKLTQVVPYYQAIISADTHSIYGYEVLGRMKVGDKVSSLGPFFHNGMISDKEKLEVDVHLQNLVFNNLIKGTNQQQFFINVQANHLIKEQGNLFINRLLNYQSRGLDLTKIVLEMTEHDFMGELKELIDQIRLLKSFGIKIALDDVGTGSSNLDRIGIMEPDILKVDIHSLKNKEATVSYHGVLYSLSLLSRKIGADLLFEAIEDKDQLHSSWRNNGRFFQGYFLSMPQPILVDKDEFKKPFKNEIREFIQLEKKKLQAEFTLAVDLNQRLQQMIHNITSFQNLDQTMISLAAKIEDVCCRMYMTNEHGYQQTSNAVKIDGIWVVKPQYKGLNWGWRPYFLENIIKMEQENKGILSDVYSDIETGELIRTFSFPISSELFLFIDIPMTMASYE